MIASADIFAALRASESTDDQYRAAHESASLETWLAVVSEYPDLRFWVAQNKMRTMTIAVGPEKPLSFSVWTAAAASFLLASLRPTSGDQLPEGD